MIYCDLYCVLKIGVSKSAIEPEKRTDFVMFCVLAV